MGVVLMRKSSFWSYASRLPVLLTADFVLGRVNGP
jgi:hypothetical protein